MKVNFRLCASGCAGESDATFERLETARGLYNQEVHQLRGDLETKDVKAAFKSMQDAARLDYAPAEVALGLLYLEGTGTAVDSGKAAEWFDRAAAQGNPQGDYELARLYATGNGVKMNQPEAPEAQYAAGMLLEKGDGAPQDAAQAFKWYHKSAEQGFSPAQYRLANAYWDGIGGKQDKVKALGWALIASSHGEKLAAAAVQDYRAAMTPEEIEAAERGAGKFKPHQAIVK